jgi:hypothetical protein
MSRVSSAGVGLGALTAATLAGVGFVTSYRFWRTRCLTWGTREDEAVRPLPGDDLLPAPDLLATRAISIDAPPSAVWPWLVQMGPGRGGLYTYDWIENLFGLGMHSVNEVLPELQNIDVGFAQQLGKSGPVLRVAVINQGNAFVLRSDDGNWVWAFILVPTGPGTRLLSRNRIAVPNASRFVRMVNRYVMEPGSLIMERKMLLGIKKRAEDLAGHSVPPMTDLHVAAGIHQ